jgi:hypothetical protein
MTDFNSNPDALKATTDGDAGAHHDGDHARATTMGGTAGANLTAIREDMEVVGSDGRHVGEIDHFRDGQLKLKRQDSEATDGQHHFVPGEWVAKVDTNANRVMLNLSKDEATSRWTPAG